MVAFETATLTRAMVHSIAGNEAQRRAAVGEGDLQAIAAAGLVSGYRADYEICNGWNDLTWVATCTLKKGSVVVIGPGQSVSAESCGDPTGQETYAANLEDWQVFVSKAWSRSAELVCPADTSDYEANPADISKPKAP